MSWLEELTNTPGYDAAAKSASKATILLFIATFLYMVFLSEVSPSLLGGAAFIVVGMFAVSLLIAMPLFLLKLKIPKAGVAISIADVVLTIFLTRVVYLWLFSS